MALPYAAFPRYGPGIIGQAKYDAELQTWEAYQASLRNAETNPETPPLTVEIEEQAEDLDKFTYLRKYVKEGQARKRIFREQNIMATDKDHALRQGRDAMKTELGPMYTDDGRGAGGGATRHWKFVPNTEKAVKPRGRAFEDGEDERRNEEGTNGTAESEDAGAPNKPSTMPQDDAAGQEQNASSGGEGQEGSAGNESSEGDGAGEGGEGDIDGLAPKGKGGITTQEARKIAREVLDQNMLDEVGTIAELVAEHLNQPRRIEVSVNGKVNEVSGTPHKIYDDCLAAMTRGMNVFLCGPAGSGKGFLAQHLAEGLDQRFGFLSCSEGMSEGMVLGRGVPLADRFLYLQSSFVDFYENGGIFLLDEIDAANPNVLLIINECLSSPHLSVPNRVDNPYAVRHKDFHAIVAANTWGTGPDMEYVGRNRLDAAFLDRFIGSRFELEYDARIEGEIAKAHLGKDKAPDVLKRFWGVRKKLVDLNIRRIWSTRGLEKMCIALAAGDDMSKVLDAHTTGWTRDEKSKVGVSA